ncbi:hypothetical protein BAE44_0000145 [Dichanthelium oligosanthes]|uniref:Dolichyl-diphosphooligosaccharide--protein glycosyltransferase subunit 4A n=1 Tax=Dichanthelium oligosanthes TaxID=888268 RepID=A0A1E5WN79_9POAL|nr:hypothetical protein BAE44_0000145 [Dichanthelium oligosanthes]
MILTPGEGGYADARAVGWIWIRGRAVLAGRQGGGEPRAEPTQREPVPSGGLQRVDPVGVTGEWTRSGSNQARCVWAQMFDDQDLGFFANFLGIFIFVLVIAYHFVMADPKYEGN